jgi:hypothetical protein
MVSFIESITSPLKSAGDLVQGIVEVRDMVKLGQLQVKLQGQIMAALAGATAAQQNELAMGEEIRRLKARVVELETWEAEKKRYILDKLPPGVFVYSLKPEMAAGEPPHQICERCYNEGKKFLLHQGEQRNGVYNLVCNGCRTQLHVGHFRPPEWDGNTGYNPFGAV